MNTIIESNENICLLGRSTLFCIDKKCSFSCMSEVFVEAKLKLKQTKPTIVYRTKQFMYNNINIKNITI